MSIAEQALFLLDLVPNSNHRKKMENFPSLDLLVQSSLQGTPIPENIAPTPGESYTVAGRLGRANYEEYAKAEALLHALKQMRARNVAKPPNTTRVLRGI